MLATLCISGCALFVTDQVVDKFMEKVSFRVERVQLKPKLDPTILFGGANSKLDVDVEVTLTNENTVGLQLVALEVKGYFNETLFIEGKPQLSEGPLKIPAGETTKMVIQSAIPLAALPGISLDVLLQPNVTVRMEGTATGEAMGVQLTRNFVVQEVQLKTRKLLPVPLPLPF